MTMITLFRGKSRGAPQKDSPLVRGSPDFPWIAVVGPVSIRGFRKFPNGCKESVSDLRSPSGEITFYTNALFHKGRRVKTERRIRRRLTETADRQDVCHRRRCRGYDTTPCLLGFLSFRKQHPWDVASTPAARAMPHPTDVCELCEASANSAFKYCFSINANSLGEHSIHQNP